MESRKKILFLAYFYPPAAGKALPGSQRTVKFIRYLRSFDKYVLTIDPGYYPAYFSQDQNTILPINDERIIRTGTFDFFSLFLKFRQFLSAHLKRSTPHSPSESKASLLNPTSNNTKKSSFLKKLKDGISDLLTLPDFASPWILPAFWQGLKTVRKERIDCIFATGMPWSSLIAARMIQLFTGVKVVADFRDPWVNNPYISGKTALRSRLERFLEKSIVIASDAVILNTEELRNDFIHRYPSLKKEKFHTLMNGYDEKDFDSTKSVPIQKNTGELILSHAGFLYGARDPKPIFQAISKIRENNKDLADKIIFQQIGDLSLNYDLEKFLTDCDCSRNYRAVGQKSYRECLELMKNSDVLVIIQQATATQIPSKIYEYIFLQKPVLTISQKEGALSSLIQRFGVGDLFAPHEIDNLAACLLQHLDQKSAPQKPFLGYGTKNTFDVKTITHQLESIVKKIIDGPD